jgi:hypothetical protein
MLLLQQHVSLNSMCCMLLLPLSARLLRGHAAFTTACVAEQHVLHTAAASFSASALLLHTTAY